MWLVGAVVWAFGVFYSKLIRQPQMMSRMVHIRISDAEV